MARKKMSEEERRKKRREAEQRRRDSRKVNKELREEDRLKRRLRYEEAKKKKKVKMIGEMSAREKRNARKRWRESRKRYYRRQKMRIAALSYSPPLTPTYDSPEDPTPGQSRVRERNYTSGRKRVRCNRSKAYILIEKQKIEMGNLRREASKYKARYYRLKNSLNNKIDLTPKSEAKKIERDLKNKDGMKGARKKLLLACAVKHQISVNSKKMTPTQKQIFTKSLKGDILKKYKLLSQAGEFFSYKMYRSNFRRNIQNYRFERVLKSQSVMVQNQIKAFFDQDDNSRICPGKKDVVSRNGTKFQKRYLNDTLRNLHKKFVSETGKNISYASFCRLRPRYVVEPKINARDTCLCLRHENMNLLVKKLSSSGIVFVPTATDLVKSVTCDPVTEECLGRNCTHCKNTTFEVKPSNESQLIFITEWVTKNHTVTIKGKDKMVKRTVKQERPFTDRAAISYLKNSLPDFMAHLKNIKHQSSVFKDLRNLSSTSLTIHVDFSENYGCKYAREPQSVHFGASRQQLCLHTGVAYCGSEHHSFCTVSANLRHDPRAVVAHLQPILNVLMVKFPSVDTLHFISDGPTGQYRNRTMFTVIGAIFPKLFTRIQRITWNYSEAGHGKGAADGIGGVVKRTADRVVAQRCTDIKDLNSFMNVLKSAIKKVDIRQVDEQSFTDTDKLIPENILIGTVKNTMQVHQATWSRCFNTLHFNKLSCFVCQPGTYCVHYSIDHPVLLLEDDESLVSSSARQPGSTYQTPTFPLSLEEGDWIAVTQGRSWLPGILERIVDDTTLQVNLLEPSGEYFSWPSTPVRQTVDKESVIYKMEPPISISTRLMLVKDLGYINFLRKNNSLK